MVAIRKDLSSLAGLGTFPNREPSHKWLGYFQGRRRDAGNGLAHFYWGGGATPPAHRRNH